MVSLEPQTLLGLRESPATWMIPPAKHLKGAGELATMGVTLSASCREIVEKFF